MPQNPWSSHHLSAVDLHPTVPELLQPMGAGVLGPKSITLTLPSLGHRRVIHQMGTRLHSHGW